MMMRRGVFFLLLLLLLVVLSVVVVSAVEGKKAKGTTKASIKATARLIKRSKQQQNQHGKKVMRKQAVVVRNRNAPRVTLNANKDGNPTKSKSVKLKILKKRTSKRKTESKVDLGLIGDLSKSTFLTANQSKRFIDELLKDVKTRPMKLLYNASKDGFRARSFHSKCDNQGPTVTIIKASSGAIFGGYTSVSWSSAMLDFFPDSKAFLFSLIGPKRDERFKKLIQDGPHSAYVNYSVYHRSVDHPTFGGGHDIFIARGTKKSFTNPFTYSNLGKDYLTGSTREFTTLDYEVYSL
ncbi:predicted protein [Naegleria gruberi]|uniref:Predicted protein n=1 Tax=Naegleria gruberi TaxID=5762 RepID=D2VW69_NAEGR|nr:uncharacterized protein NAEGRDRAFT_73274 [Naegleria gruberi]EFC39027.1 predicted protein [Naegleria gruberi]|eukprot:XP_002671771.1 predicted protein [Naegleria gruberi strain NEG-M]